MTSRLGGPGDAANRDLQPLRDAIASGEMAARRDALRPTRPSGASNQNHLAERDVQRLPTPAAVEAPSDGDESLGVVLALGAAAAVGTVASYAYEWFTGPPVASPVAAPPAVQENDNAAPPVNIFLPRDADEADLEAIRRAGLTAGDAEMARMLAEEDAREAARAKQQRDAEEAANLRFSQKLHELAAKK